MDRTNEVKVSEEQFLKIQKLRETENLILLSRSTDKNVLKRLKPILKEGSPTENKTFVLKTEYNIRIGHTNEGLFFIDPSGGPMLQVGKEVPIVWNIDGLKIIDTINIKDITFRDNIGYIITIE